MKDLAILAYSLSTDGM